MPAPWEMVCMNLVPIGLKLRSEMSVFHFADCTSPKRFMIILPDAEAKAIN